ncbi:MAG: PEGA domain-containing protein [Vicinamibacterales bacterium]
MSKSATPAATAPAAPKRAAPAPPPGSAATPAEPAPRKPIARKATTAPEPLPSAPTTATLMLETDVPGASVFINRQYVGVTPLTLEKLEPGEKQFKLTAEGFDGIERQVNLKVGDNPVTLRFREVRLNEQIQVTHKHAMGSCEGTLTATVDGITYDTPNKNDAFKLVYSQLDTFAVDYLEKNLKLKQKGGKQWNFTDKNAANADKLFVFHREVEAARKKLADGYTPVR